jgi:serine/threonine protein kinase
MRRSNNNKLVLIDFGSVKWNPQTNLKVPATRVYTPNYAPFEQIKGKTQYNSDLYALGITAIQCLTNQLLSDEEEIINYLQKSQISTKLKVILMKMIEYKYQQRYQSAQEVLDCFPSSQITLEEEKDTIVVIPPSHYDNKNSSHISEEKNNTTIFVPIPITKNDFIHNKIDFLIKIMFILMVVFSIFFILEMSGIFNKKKAPQNQTKQSLSLKFYTINNIF